MKIQKNEPVLEILGLRSSFVSLDSLVVRGPVLLLLLLWVFSSTVR